MMATCSISPQISSVLAEIDGLLKPEAKALTLEQSEKLHESISCALLEIDRPVEAKDSYLGSVSTDIRLNSAKGVLLWSHLEKTIGEVKYDSFGSKLLPLFPSVLSFNKARFQDLVQKVKFQFELSDDELTKILGEVQFLISNLLVKNSIIEFLLKKLSTGTSHQALFRAITGSNALNHELIDVTLTNATIFFTFDFEDNGLEPSQHYSLSDQYSLKDLLNKLDMFSDVERTDFPAVGKWRRLEIDKMFLDEMASDIFSKTEMTFSQEVLEKTLLTMIYLLPRKHAESFFVHDAYGHSWQESICEFEHFYQYINTLKDPIESSDLEQVDISALNVKENTEQVYRELEDYYERQIQVAINAILAEFTADAMEYHLQAQLEEKGQSIPTSSKMRHFTLFLDLSFNDVKKHFGSLRKAVKSQFARENTQKLNGLFEQHYSKAEADKVVAELKVKFEERIGTLFSETSDETNNQIESIVFVQLLRVYLAIDMVAKSNDAKVLQQLLLVLTTNFQANPSINFWFLDKIAEDFRFVE